MKNIPFNKPYLTGGELDNVRQAYRLGWVSGDGKFTKLCQRRLERDIGCRRAMLTTSATTALEMAALLCGIKPGDEVLLPSYTFVSTANAFVLRGAKPVFVDIREDTLNIDERLIGRRISRKSRALCVVHYAGVACEMAPIVRQAAAGKLALIEDAAQAIGAKYRGRPLGTFGQLAALSFHETKNVICGEGGALLINDRRHILRAEIIREKGTNRNQFYRGEVDKYSWVDIGSSYLPSDILAAFLYAQLEKQADIQRRRKKIYDRYRAGLADLAEAGKVRLPFVPAHCQQNYHMFYILLPLPKIRDRVMSRLKKRGIDAIFHYVPLHLSPMGRQYGYKKGDLPVTESAAGRLLRLPFYNTLSAADQAYVIDNLRQVVREEC